MKVEFLQDWQGNPKGTQKELLDDFCKLDLIPRGIVKELPNEAFAKLIAENAKLKAENKKLKAKTKQVTEAKNKMQSSPAVDK